MSEGFGEIGCGLGALWVAGWRGIAMVGVVQVSDVFMFYGIRQKSSILRIAII